MSSSRQCWADSLQTPRNFRSPLSQNQTRKTSHLLRNLLSPAFSQRLKSTSRNHPLNETLKTFGYLKHLIRLYLSNKVCAWTLNLWVKSLGKWELAWPVGHFEVAIKTGSVLCWTALWDVYGGPNLSFLCNLVTANKRCNSISKPLLYASCNSTVPGSRTRMWRDRKNWCEIARELGER